MDDAFDDELFEEAVRLAMEQLRAVQEEVRP
jgi:hypothetical protein